MISNKDFWKDGAMKPKKILIEILIVVFAFILFTIWYQNCIRKTVPTTSLALVKNFDIYLITTDEDYQFWQYVNNGAEDMATLTGVRYYWRAPDERSPEKQVEIINEAVNSGAEALLVVADDPILISGVIEDAKARGVKVVYVDAPSNEEAITTLSTENYEAGFAAGQIMLSKLTDMGINEGAIGIINIRDKITTMQRVEGFRDALAEEPSYNVLEAINTNGEPRSAQLAAEQIIEQNSDLVGLFGTNEGTSQGVGNAIKANDNRFVGVGFDKSDITLDLLYDGSLKAIIDQNPYTMGYLGMAEAIAAVLGKDTGPDYIDTGFKILE
ncbi:MAG: periplasmic binding protein/LacI transcriptional regulator [Herbinix sp.]|jgi:ribose transport system substrate-binding protein|nr:periplasmic binding protein/LacI transcriptional regulator [Herbinix sp.]